jgi:hypothetical protein
VGVGKNPSTDKLFLLVSTDGGANFTDITGTVNMPPLSAW